MLHGIGGVLCHIGGRWKQVWTVAQRRHIQGVPGELILAHNVDGQMGQVEVFQRHGANVVIVIDPVCVGMGVALFVRPCVRFEVVAALRHHRFRQNVLLFKEHLQRSLYLVHRPRPFVYGADNRQQHIGIVFNVIQLKVVFVIIVSAFVAVQIVLQLGLQPAVGGLGPAQIGILGGIGGRADGPHHAVANRHRRGHTRLHEHQQQKTGKEQQHPHRMPLDKGHGPGRQLFRCDRRFLCGLGRLLCSLPRLLCVLPLDFLLLDIPGHRAALLHFRVGLHRGPVLIIRCGLDVPGLGLLHRFGRVLPDLLFYIPGCGAQGGLTDQLGSVGAFGADILMLYLI